MKSETKKIKAFSLPLNSIVCEWDHSILCKIISEQFNNDS